MAKMSFKFVNEAAKRDFMNLPHDIRMQFSVDLTAVQNGQKPLSPIKDIGESVGTGAFELIENGSPAYRAVYCAKYMNTVFILHAFTKTAQGTDKPNMKTAAARHQVMMEEVREAKKEEKNKKRGG